MRRITLTYISFLFAIIVCAQNQIGNNINGTTSFDAMGWDTAISGDGQSVVVGVPGNSINAYGAGMVKVLSFDGVDWVAKGNDLFGLQDEDNFGRAIDITNDGNTIIVGALYSDANGLNSGSVQVFEYDGSSWNQKGNTLTGTNQEDEFGTTVSISDDGNRIAVGAPYTNTSDFDNGVLRIFDFDGTNWNLTFEAFGDNENDVFGMSLDMSANGNHVVCGAWINEDNTAREGYVKIYEFANATWSQVGGTINGESPSTFFGAASSISNDGTIVAVGAWGNDSNATDSGKVKVYERENTNWQQLGSDISGVSSFQRFGWAIDLSSTGGVLGVGAPQGNKAQIFKFESNSWTYVGNTISGAAVNDEFGFSISLSSDGTKVIIGDPGNNANGSNSGFAQVYDITNALSLENFTNQELKVFPNPTNNELTVSSKHSINFIEVLDINGRILKTCINNEADLEMTVNVSDLSKGVYFARLISEAYSTTKKIVKN